LINVGLASVEGKKKSQYILGPHLRIQKILALGGISPFSNITKRSKQNE